MCQNIGRLMVTARTGSIVNIASQHGIVGNDMRAPYCASKAGVINLARELALEWAKYNIRVNCVSPTFVMTEKNKKMLTDNINFKKTLTSIPMGRYCTPLDVAQSVLFLSSPLASLITGHNLVVDGGYTIR
jgi:2-deoxy-D-gluconate 3-dehydrogenase